MSNVSLLQHPASIDAYIRHGWSLVPVPSGSKGPAHEGWNRRENCLRSQSDLPPSYGIGLAHAYSGTMAIDVDDWGRASFELMTKGVDLNALYTAPDAVVIDSGRHGHGKLIYAMPFGLVLPSKKLTDTDDTGKRYNYIDFRCATADGMTVQDVLPPSIHPDTKQPYRWSGYGHWTRLPMIPASILDIWQSLIDRDNAKNVTSGEAIPTSWEEVEKALSHIDPSCDRKTWIDIGAALHLAGSQHGVPDVAWRLWDEWSAKSPKYAGQGKTFTQWRAFRDTKSSVVTLGTLFHHAKKAGYTRPLPDVSTLFAPTQSTAVASPQDLTEGMRPMPPVLDFDLVPEILRRRANEVGESIGCDPIIPLFAGLAAVCGVVDARARLELLEGYQVPPLLWLCTIGDPADKKTPGSAPMMQVLQQLEAEDRPRWQKEFQDWEGKEAMYASSKKAYLEFAGSTDALFGLEHAPKVYELPPQPQPLRLLVSDITSQKLVRHAAERPRGLLCYLDEMYGWVRKVCDRNSGEDRSAWVKAYESNRYEMDRVGTGSVVAENFAVAIYGNIQPKVFRDNVEPLGADGLIQRFIPAIPRRSMNKRGNPMPVWTTNREQWDILLRSIHALPLMNYKLSPQARERFRGFQLWYEAKKQDEWLLQSTPVYMTAFGKLEGTCGRLMFIWHMIENPYDTEVSESVANRVIELCKSFVVPSLRHVFMEIGELNGLDGWMIDFIIQHSDKDRINLTELKRSARRQIEHLPAWHQSTSLISSMATLEQRYWVARIDDGSQEHRGIAEWAINPQLIIRFKEHRDAVIKAKQRFHDEVVPNRVKRQFIYGYDPEQHDE